MTIASNNTMGSKTRTKSINNNYLLRDGTNTIGIYGQSIQILKNKIDNYNTNDIELFDAILSAVYSDLRLDAFTRFEKSMFYKTYIKYKSMELNHKCSILISNSLHLSVVFGNKINEYNNQYRHTIFAQFNEPYTNTNDRRLILNALRYENNIDSAIADINKIDNKCKSLFLYNTIKFKQHFSENDFDELDVPLRLKIILSRKLNMSYKQYNINNKEYINVEESASTNSVSYTTQFQKQFDGTTSTAAICFVLAQILLTDDIDYIKQMLKPLFDLKYKRMYHLSTINLNIFNELLINVPSCLKITLWKMMQSIHREYSNGFPFHADQKRQTSAINSTSCRYNNIGINKLKLAMKTTDVFTLLESLPIHKLNVIIIGVVFGVIFVFGLFLCILFHLF